MKIICWSAIEPVLGSSTPTWWHLTTHYCSFHRIQWPLCADTYRAKTFMHIKERNIFYKKNLTFPVEAFSLTYYFDNQVYTLVSLFYHIYSLPCVFWWCWWFEYGDRYIYLKQALIKETTWWDVFLLPCGNLDNTIAMKCLMVPSCWAVLRPTLMDSKYHWSGPGRRLQLINSGDASFSPGLLLKKGYKNTLKMKRRKRNSTFCNVVNIWHYMKNTLASLIQGRVSFTNIANYTWDIIKKTSMALH